MNYGYKVKFLGNMWAWFAEEQEAIQYVLDCAERYTLGDQYTIEPVRPIPFT